MNPADIRRLDHAHVWHPYAPADGRHVIDAMSSWWASVHGHGHPALVAAATEQIERMPSRSP